MFTKTRIYNAVILLMVVFLIDNAIKTKSRYLQLENEKSPLRDYNIENKENNTALLSAEDKISAAVHEPSTLPVVASNIPHVHSNLHPDNLILINISNFKININFDICNVSQIGLVTIVHTAVQNAEARRAIRDTWGHPKIPGVNTR
ncbi:uncharacterized protein LOC111707921 [Eurytemora carolleeae]|uniref:uncharacterized protein LOC111707921 n=1 Tax=Eurytemora carolleeae TaxID=1294199 RepID=UPI000C766B36|nr:uncharacterized protein LOC111707921 [Eurytemora carolleeae]|eukprot:XP_023336877.1 uncharacterized protein LOC111707921 [Eurytemora affinis]